MVQPLSSNQDQFQWQQAQRILEMLSTLSYRASGLDSYLKELVCGLSQLLSLDWSVVTCCWEDKEKIIASSLDLGAGEQIYSLHGTLTNTVFSTGKTLQVKDTNSQTKYGQPPEGYRSYLGVPLQTPGGKTFGTICSFCVQPRYFGEEELRTAQLFAERAAIAIDNYNLYQQQQDFNQALETEVAIRTKQLKETQAKLIEKEKLAAIGQFASMIVHEIRNPLTTMMMCFNALKQLQLEKRNLMRITLAREEGERLLELLKEILLYAKPPKLELETIEVAQFVEEVLWELRQMPMTSGREIRLICQAEKIKMRADKNKLKQIVINLVQNACEAITPGEVVTCRLTKERKPESICFSTHNQGSPIPEEMIPKLSEPFVSNKAGGTGLGLAIVKQIVYAHQGVLSIQSNAVEGTTISFTIPSTGSGSNG
ncbi:Signal transduction histidine kinase [Hyella patelloides LEGE 07179]|uniref:histidine kinase n=1 Tax=Hyella patelloides LEGE 07179 TaxID=945734 RepID=A0A563W4U2_9CYAN|nr:GAF domain-containing sensor histidine kinase [Hyella patelloides]VEP18722.1 Signal transduction histidine kinase [Hyella patelloides LEGE 07179]